MCFHWMMFYVHCFWLVKNRVRTHTLENTKCCPQQVPLLCIFLAKYPWMSLHNQSFMHVCCMSTQTYTDTQPLQPLAAAYIVSYGRPVQKIALLNHTINLLPKAPPCRLSSTAPPTNSTCTSSRISVCLQLDSGWNTKVSEKKKRFMPLDVYYNSPGDVIVVWWPGTKNCFVFPNWKNKSYLLRELVPFFIKWPAECKIL